MVSPEHCHPSGCRCRNCHSDILEFTQLEFGVSGSDSWRWMYDDYDGYLTNLENGGLLTQVNGVVILAAQLSYTEPDPSQQWILDYNGQTHPV